MPKVYADDAGIRSKDSEDIDVTLENHGMICLNHTTKTERQ